MEGRAILAHARLSRSGATAVLRFLLGEGESENEWRRATAER